MTLRAHSVTADVGSVVAQDFEDRIPVVRLVFHMGLEGETPVHNEQFMDPAGLPKLIEQLVSLQVQLAASG